MVTSTCDNEAPLSFMKRDRYCSIPLNSYVRIHANQLNIKERCFRHLTCFSTALLLTTGQSVINVSCEHILWHSNRTGTNMLLFPLETNVSSSVPPSIKLTVLGSTTFALVHYSPSSTFAIAKDHRCRFSPRLCAVIWWNTVVNAGGSKNETERKSSSDMVVELTQPDVVPVGREHCT